MNSRHLEPGAVSKNKLSGFDPLPDFYNILIDELTRLSADSATDESIAQYYKRFLNEPGLRPFYQYNWLRRVQPMVGLLQTLPRRAAPWRVLDAGCGVGTESRLWASLRDNVEVVGVDISAARLQAAAARAPFYEKQIGRPLAVGFSDQSAFTILSEQSFDLIWTMEAISHIDPAEAFISAAYESLNSDGRLVISDSHFLNPAMLWRIFKLRRKGIKHTYKTTTSGEVIPYAEERLFSVPALSRLLRRAGFNVVSTQLSVFLPPRAACIPRLALHYAGVDRLFNAIPLARYAGGIYTIVAAKL